ncbi:hypothetical protein LTR10_017071 [Elasticomyces elasticus]|uniref:Transcription factor domain-containing protein n=1 Tax=Exophiala sideris TaxID=1016849 RepID=A0ABR0IZM6_9EURO|nr:hypothetical protein LTR10_017071 [Elasticomyces elasticus]KAK5023079.1 hypothetical protein LTS07_009572 [Exophiala sideris]KAK5026804.1 hypothetical protein LTR13_009844 [Exophiala sideris]KAK5052457.1 hypothetical protein LTR69_009795 [Exophiala sideris]KAK5178242.1 hypothetical protein LTR44_009326 [Eurotiomycetes sp. CCFEE 6388]
MHAAGIVHHGDTLPRQPGLKFIPEDGSSRYCKRLTEEESKDAKEIVIRLHQAGGNRAAMMKEISSKVLQGRRISKAMVDGLRDQLGLIQRQNGRIAKEQESMSRTEEECAVLCWTQNDNQTDHALAPSLQVPEDSAAIASQTYQYESSTGQILQDMETSEAELETPLTMELKTFLSLSDEDIAMLDYQYQSQSSVDSEVDWATNILADQRQTDEHGAVVNPDHLKNEANHPQDMSELRTLYYHALSNTRRFSGAIETDGQRSTMPSTQSGLWEWSEAHDITSLNHAAYILSTLRDFQQAFEMYFLIYCRLLKPRTDNQAPNPHFVLSAIGCARTARTPSQVILAHSLVDRVREDLLLHHGLWLLERTRTWKFLEGFYHKYFNSDNESWENVEDAAYWVATAIILSQPRLAAHIVQVNNMPDYFLPGFWHNSFVAHILDCDVAMVSMRTGISKLSAFIRKRKGDLDPLLRGWLGLSADEDTIAEHGKIVSTMFLDDHLRSRTSARVGSTIPSHAGFPCCWNEFATLTMPFMLIKWAHRPEFKANHASFLQRARTTKTSDFLLLAADEIRGHLKSRGGKEAVFDLYLRLMAAPRHADHVRPQSSLPPGLFLDVTKVLNLDYDIGDWTNLGSDSILTREQPEEDTAKDGISVSKKPADTASLNASVPMSDTSSISSGYRSFLELSRKVRNSVSLTIRTRQSASSGALTTRSSWSFSRNAGFPRDPSIRESQVTLSSDVNMSG